MVPLAGSVKYLLNHLASSNQAPTSAQGVQNIVINSYIIVFICPSFVVYRFVKMRVSRMFGPLSRALFLDQL